MNKRIERIVAGNWKMHGTTHKSLELAGFIEKYLQDKNYKTEPTVVLIPPFTQLSSIAKGSTSYRVGAQNMHHEDQGAFTGEISGAMLLDLFVTYVLIGHSERRQLFGETNQSINLKLKSAFKHNMKPILCVGETLDERESNLTDSVVKRQIVAALLDIEYLNLTNLVIAYEPIWAIGTGLVCEPNEANRVTKLLRSTIMELYKNHTNSPNDNSLEAIPILYGGSVKGQNAASLAKASDINGVLVGGASLNAQEFCEIINAFV